MDIYPEAERRRGENPLAPSAFPRLGGPMFHLRSIATCLILATVNYVTPRRGVALAVTMIDLATMDGTDGSQVWVSEVTWVN